MEVYPSSTYPDVEEAVLYVWSAGVYAEMSA
jgi:hypothetical protein